MLNTKRLSIFQVANVQHCGKLFITLRRKRDFSKRKRFFIGCKYLYFEYYLHLSPGKMLKKGASGTRNSDIYSQ